jgi:hypothetical protein
VRLSRRYERDRTVKIYWTEENKKKKDNRPWKEREKDIIFIFFTVGTGDLS